MSGIITINLISTFLVSQPISSTNINEIIYEKSALEEENNHIENS